MAGHVIPHWLFTGPFTLFAPSETSLGNVDATDTAKVTALMKYHVAYGQYLRADLYNEESLTSLQANQTIRVNHYISKGVGARVLSIRLIGQNMKWLDPNIASGLHWYSDGPSEMKNTWEKFVDFHLFNELPWHPGQKVTCHIFALLSLCR